MEWNDEALCKDLIHWMLYRMAKSDHGCLTGDCPHYDQDDCLEALLNAYLIDDDRPRVQ